MSIEKGFGEHLGLGLENKQININGLKRCLATISYRQQQ